LPVAAGHDVWCHAKAPPSGHFCMPDFPPFTDAPTTVTAPVAGIVDMAEANTAVLANDECTNTTTTLGAASPYPVSETRDIPTVAAVPPCHFIAGIPPGNIDMSPSVAILRLRGRTGKKASKCTTAPGAGTVDTVYANTAAHANDKCANTTTTLGATSPYLVLDTADIPMVAALPTCNLFAGIPPGNIYMSPFVDTLHPKGRNGQDAGERTIAPVARTPDKEGTNATATAATSCLLGNIVTRSTSNGSNEMQSESTTRYI